VHFFNLLTPKNKTDKMSIVVKQGPFKGVEFSQPIRNKYNVIGLQHPKLGIVAFLVGDKDKGSLVFQDTVSFEAGSTMRGKQYMWESNGQREALFTASEKNVPYHSHGEFFPGAITVWSFQE
jgi:hypothetical protein